MGETTPLTSPITEFAANLIHAFEAWQTVVGIASYRIIFSNYYANLWQAASYLVRGKEGLTSSTPPETRGWIVEYPSLNCGNVSVAGAKSKDWVELARGERQKPPKPGAS